MSVFDIFGLAAMAAFLILFLGRTWMLKRRGIRILVLGQGKHGLKKALEILVFIAGPLWMAGVISMAISGRIPFVPTLLSATFLEVSFLKLLGSAMVFAGLFIFAWALVSFKDSWRIGIDRTKAGELITDGIFSWSRNPVFLFMDLYVVGTFLIYPNLFFSIFALGMILGIHLQILQEEQFLLSQYREDYQDYLVRVNRYCTLKSR